MDWLPPLLAGLVLGAGAGILLGRMLAASRTRAELAEASAAAEREHAKAVGEVHAQLAAAKAQLETWQQAETQRKQEHDAMRRQLEDSFAALAGKALDANSQRLLDKTDLKLKPFTDQLKELHLATQELEKKRERAYGTLDEQLRHLHESTSSLKSQSDKLTTALRGSSQARGKWGEATLLRLVEMADMVEHCDFELQVSTGDGSRPDMVIRLPEGGCVPLDAKAPGAAFLDAAEVDESERTAKMKEHANAVRAHALELARRDYASALGSRADLTVMFLPNEALLSAALSALPGLFEEALAKRVLMVSPVTLLALLRTIRLGWANVHVEENARRIEQAASELVSRLATFAEHFTKSGKALDQMVRAHNAAVGSYSGRIVPQGRKLKELGAGAKSEVAEVPLVDHQVREMPAADPGEEHPRELEAGD